MQVLVHYLPEELQRKVHMLVLYWNDTFWEVPMT